MERNSDQPLALQMSHFVPRQLKLSLRSNWWCPVIYWEWFWSGVNFLIALRKKSFSETKMCHRNCFWFNILQSLAQVHFIIQIFFPGVDVSVKSVALSTEEFHTSFCYVILYFASGFIKAFRTV